ncbi:copper-binding protein, partial [Methylonatrum kenyense]|uniref:copper-binding protein n=1 Tax=Methylonatrum kenyense TaxID=455253 RepID=UPI0020C06CD8
ILEGLQAGERIVTSGQFLIDSESSVTVSLARMQAEAAAEEADDGSVAAEGRINHVDEDARQVNLDHDPIAELGWPAMTMDFDVADGVDLGGLQPGDAVIIRIRERADEEYAYELTHIEPLDAPSADADDAPDHDPHAGHDH